ncbi:MAG: hypothetical protein NVS2B7_34660 [Herpetosiphon sp.]
MMSEHNGESQQAVDFDAFRDLREGMTIGDFTILRDVSRTDHFRVFHVARQGEGPDAKGCGLAVYRDKDASRASDLPWLLLRYSDFGYDSRQKIIRGPRSRGGVCLIGGDLTPDIRYTVWMLDAYRLSKPLRKNEFTPTVRTALLKAAEGKCESCLATTDLEYDHIVPVALGGTGDLENGMVLCRQCHLFKTRLQVGKFPNRVLDLKLSGQPPYKICLFGKCTYHFASKLAMWRWLGTNANNIRNALIYEFRVEVQTEIVLYLASDSLVITDEVKVRFSSVLSNVATKIPYEFITLDVLPGCVSITFSRFMSSNYDSVAILRIMRSNYDPLAAHEDWNEIRQKIRQATTAMLRKDFESFRAYRGRPLWQRADRPRTTYTINNGAQHPSKYEAIIEALRVTYPWP